MQSVKTKLDHLFSCLGEECGEVQQVLGKIDRFGLNDIKPGTDQPNWEKLRIEVHDIMAVYEMYCNEVGYKPELSRHLIKLKKEKVEELMIYSRSVGLLEEIK